MGRVRCRLCSVVQSIMKTFMVQLNPDLQLANAAKKFLVTAEKVGA